MAVRRTKKPSPTRHCAGATHAVVDDEGVAHLRFLSFADLGWIVAAVRAGFSRYQRSDPALQRESPFVSLHGQRPRQVALMMPMHTCLMDAMKMKPELWRAPYVDVETHMGRWYEVVRTPTSGDDLQMRDVFRDYTLREDGFIDVVSTYTHSTLGKKVFHGEATATDSANSRWKVDYPGTVHSMPFFRGEIYIIKVDVAGQIALLGQPDRKHMCLLYRKPVVEPAIAEAWLKIGEAQGFSTSNLVWPINSDFEIPAPRY